MRLGRLEASFPLQIMATTWSAADEIDACNGDFIVAIIEVIAINTILTKNHLSSLKDLFRLNPKQLRKKNYRKLKR
jgi:hypothetical protein